MIMDLVEVFEYCAYSGDCDTLEEWKNRIVANLHFWYSGVSGLRMQVESLAWECIRTAFEIAFDLDSGKGIKTIKKHIKRHWIIQLGLLMNWVCLIVTNRCIDVESLLNLVQGNNERGSRMTIGWIEVKHDLRYLWFHVGLWNQLPCFLACALNCLQVEYYFSDLNLATTDHLMRFITKDPEGYGKVFQLLSVCSFIWYFIIIFFSLIFF
jgi:hypothetical protein